MVRERRKLIEMWHDEISAKNRRILMTQWTGHAWTEPASKPELIQKLFEKTGCLVTVDGSHTDKIKPQGQNLYSF